MARLPVVAPITTNPQTGQRELSIPGFEASIDAMAAQAYIDLGGGGGGGYDDTAVRALITGNTNAINALTPRVAALETNLSGLPARVTTAETSIAALNSRVTTLEDGGGSGGLTSVAHDTTLTGAGTSASPLAVARPVPAGTSGQVVGYGAGGALVPMNVSGGGVGAVTEVTPPSLAAPWVQSSVLRFSDGDYPVPVGHLGTRDIRSFGDVTLRQLNEVHAATITELTTAQLNANTAAMVAAEEWSFTTGGFVSVPGQALLDINAAIVFRAGFGIGGVGEHHSAIRQRAVARASGETYADVFTAHPTLGAGFNTFQNLLVHGGWTGLKAYEGAAGATWEYDIADMNAAGIRLSTLGATETVIGNGPGPSFLYPNGNPDSQNRIRNVKVQNVAGYGLHCTGRGEQVINGLWTKRCAKNGLMTAIADSWYDNITCELSGDSAIKALTGSSNARWNNIKGWYAGCYKPAEVVGAGFEMPDAGTQNVIAVNLTTQDTWGPGLVIQGNSGIDISAQVDEAGGGRLPGTAGGLGFTGTRTKPRADVRFPGTLRYAKVRVSRQGGWRGTTPASADLPYPVDIEGSPEHCHIEVTGPLSILQAGTTYTVDMATGAGPGGRLKTNGVLYTNAYVNAKRYNTVRHLEKLLLGQVSPTELDDLTHGVNNPIYGPTEVFTTLGVKAKRRQAIQGGGWDIEEITRVVTEDEYDDLTTAEQNDGARTWIVVANP